eukprot:TRINITY_DN2822_c1_g2_i2.p2 TRINITY_DN2822_c1_g2~~TRINITY_DN2822_c1_g2_i2.p2  ORF type:complete len:449 (+),score=76.03 TRINITY_DN2822_c1_g2_i2:136-1482(+)
MPEFAGAPSVVAPPPGLPARRTGSSTAAGFWPQLQQNGRRARMSRSPRRPQDVAEPHSSTDRLLGQVVSQLAQMNIRCEHDQHYYTDPRQILRKADPSLRDVLSSWFKETKSLIDAFVTHTELRNKYSKLEQSHLLLRSLADEAKKGHQWTKLYLAEAGPSNHAVDTEFMQQKAANPDLQFKVDEVYLKMREKHARECQAYIFAHQELTLEMLTSKVSVPSLQASLADKFNEWRAAQQHLTEAAKTAAHRLTEQFLDLTLRLEFPKAKSRIQKEQDKQAKRDQALAESNSKFEQLDVKSLIALAVLELGQKGSRHNSKTKKHQVQPGGVIDHLLKAQPELVTELLKKQGTSVNQLSNNPFPHADARPSRSHSHSRSRSRSGRPSSRSSRASSRSAKSWKPQVARRSRSSSVRSVRFRSRSSSVRSVRSNRTKGKGKGKGKGKQGGKSR